MLNSQPASTDFAELLLWTELQRRRTCRTSLLAWCAEALEPIGQRPAAHHRLLISELEKVIRGETRRLMVNMPPGSARSLTAPYYSRHGRSRNGMASTSSAQVTRGGWRKVSAARLWARCRS